MPESPNELAAVTAERASVYGEPHLSHANIGLGWTGLIQQHYGIKLDHPLPAFLVELMMASFKLARSTRKFHDDNYLDAANYLRFARHAQQYPGLPFPPDKPVDESAIERKVAELQKEIDRLRDELTKAVVRNRDLVRKYEGA